METYTCTYYGTSHVVYFFPLQGATFVVKFTQPFSTALPWDRAHWLAAPRMKSYRMDIKIQNAEGT